MTIGKKIHDSISRQLQTHRAVNLFFAGLDEYNFFLPETKKLINDHKDDFLKIDAENKGEEWIHSMTDRVFRVFCDTNQYLDLRKEHLQALRTLYMILWHELMTELQSETIDFHTLQKSHLRRLSEWIRQSNPFTREINKPDMPTIAEVVCAQYSAELQIGLLGINLSDLSEPVLDIGCGESANLVTHLRDMGINAFGIDRLCTSDLNFLIRSNWMEYDFKPQSWGTIISNHSFALHFTHHNERRDGDYLAYAKKYMQILDLLKVNGSLYYAPALPFVEIYLPPEKYSVTNREIDGEFFRTSIVRRLS